MASAGATWQIQSPYPTTMRILPLLLLSLATSLVAQEKPVVAAAATEAKKPESTTLEILELQGRRLALVRTINTAAEFQTFQESVQAISNEKQDVQQTKQLADLALTSPEKEARQRQLDAKLLKLTASNQTMNKAYGFDLTRQYLVVPIKLGIFKVLAEDEYIKVAAAPSFDKASVIEVSGKKLQSRTTINGAVEVETFQLQLRSVGEIRQRLQQLLDLQPKLTKDDEKKKVTTAIARVQKDVNEAEAEFAKAHGFAFSDSLATQIAAAKLYVLLSDEENQQIEKAAAEAKATSEKK